MLRTSFPAIFILAAYVFESIISQAIVSNGTYVNATSTLAYDYSSAGSNWKDTYPDCGKKDIQSPIEISDKLGMCDSELTFYAKYKTVATGALDTVYLKTDPLNRTMYFDYTDIHYYLTDLNGYFMHYESEYVYFRNPAEHKLNDIEYNVEMQVQAKLATGYTSMNATRLYVSYMFTTFNNYMYLLLSFLYDV